MSIMTTEEILNDPEVIAHGPLSAAAVEDCLEGVNPCTIYNVLLQVDILPGKGKLILLFLSIY